MVAAAAWQSGGVSAVSSDSRCKACTGGSCSRMWGEHGGVQACGCGQETLPQLTAAWHRMRGQRALHELHEQQL